MKNSHIVVAKAVLSAFALTSLAAVGRYYYHREPEKRGSYITPAALEEIHTSSVGVNTIVTLEEKVDDSYALSWFGSGVLLRDAQTGEQYILTVEHVTPDEYYTPAERKKTKSKQKKIKVLNSRITVEELTTAVVKEDENADLALLKVEGSIKLTPYQGKIARELHPQDYVIGAGFPAGNKMYFITQVKQKEEKLTLLDITFKSGNSGGGVFLLKEGKAGLAGVVTNIHGMTRLENLREFFVGTVLEDEYL